MTTLYAIQCWMLSAISRLDAVESASGVCGDTPSWPVTDRLGVYRHAYLARLLECLKHEYPIFRQTVGDDLFEEFARDYLQAHPPASYTLGDLGRRFPEFLAARRPPRSDDRPADWSDFLIDLARFEWTLSEIFDGPGTERDPSKSDAGVPPGAMHVVFQCNPSLRLQTYRFPVGAYHAAAKQSADVEFPPARATRLACVRRNYVVRHDVLGAAEFRLLQQLQSGASLATALDSLGDDEPAPDEIAGRIGSWFTTWAQRGYLIAAHSAASSSTSPVTR